MKDCITAYKYTEADDYLQASKHNSLWSEVCGTWIVWWTARSDTCCF